jgi:hypothetical protein
MSDFISFCRSLGLMINEYPPFGRWCRYSTEDHPSKKNGAVKYLGDVGWAQNHSLMSEPATWFPDSSDDIRIDAEAVRQRCEKAARELHEGRQKAASRATDMLRQCSLERHAYLDGKGFSDERGNVLALESGPLLLIPMRVAGRLVGVQTITTDGEKSFFWPAVQRCGIRDRQQGARFLLRGVRDRLERPRCAVGSEDAIPGACVLFGAQLDQISRRLPWWIGDR